jgi:hypothetical protein
MSGILPYTIPPFQTIVDKVDFPLHRSSRAVLNLRYDIFPAHDYLLVMDPSKSNNPVVPHRVQPFKPSKSNKKINATISLFVPGSSAGTQHLLPRDDHTMCHCCVRQLVMPAGLGLIFDGVSDLTWYQGQQYTVQNAIHISLGPTAELLEDNFFALLQQLSCEFATSCQLSAAAEPVTLDSSDVEKWGFYEDGSLYTLYTVIPDWLKTLSRPADIFDCVWLHNFLKMQCQSAEDLVANPFCTSVAYKAILQHKVVSDTAYMHLGELKKMVEAEYEIPLGYKEAICAKFSTAVNQ